MILPVMNDKTEMSKAPEKSTKSEDLPPDVAFLYKTMSMLKYATILNWLSSMPWNAPLFSYMVS